MPLYESPAIVLRSMRLGEADKIVTFFTARYGKIKAVAKGATKAKSRFGGRLEPFVHCNIVVFGKEKADLMRLNSCDIVEPFSLLRDSYDKLCRAYVSAELVDACQKERDVNEEGFALALAAWRMLSTEDNPDRQDLLLRVFELKYMALAGLAPRLDACVYCGAAVTPPETGYNALRGGVVCRSCLESDPAAGRISVGAVRLMARCLASPLEMVARMSAGRELLADIEKFVSEFVSTHVSRELRSERFLKI